MDNRISRLFLEREQGLQNRVITPNDLVIKGLVCAGLGIRADQGLLFAKLPREFYRKFQEGLNSPFSIETSTRYPQPWINDFHGRATVSFDGYLNDEDLKIASETELQAYSFTGEVYLVGIEHPWDWGKQFVHPLQELYYVAADFDQRLPVMMGVQAQVRISPQIKYEM